MGRSAMTTVGLTVALSMFSPAFAANAVPIEQMPPAVAAAAHVDHVVELTDQRTALFVFSPAMNKVVQVQILHPKGAAARPSLYLLDGVSAGSESDYQESTWTQKTDAVEFFADKNVNVVLPVGGTAGYYTDWERIDPVLGENRWETFLTRELPPIVDGRFRGNGVNAIAGLSMGAQGAMTLVARNPDLYRGVAALSGCMDTGRVESQAAVRGTVASKGGDADNMWGTPGDPAWPAHDPSVNAEQLRGKEHLRLHRQRAGGPVRARRTRCAREGGRRRAARSGVALVYPAVRRQAGATRHPGHIPVPPVRNSLLAVLAGRPAGSVADAGPRVGDLAGSGG